MRKKLGFTIIEFIAVVMILSIVMAFLFLKTPSSSMFSLSSITEQLRRDIRYTQILAINLNTNYTISFTTSAPYSYTISPTPPGVQSPYTVNMPSGVTLAASQGSIIFNSMGAPVDSTGTLLPDVTITLAASGVGSNTLTVTAETGYVNG